MNHTCRVMLAVIQVAYGYVLHRHDGTTCKSRPAVGHFRTDLKNRLSSYGGHCKPLAARREWACMEHGQNMPSKETLVNAHLNYQSKKHSSCKIRPAVGHFRTDLKNRLSSYGGHCKPLAARREWACMEHGQNMPSKETLVNAHLNYQSKKHSSA